MKSIMGVHGILIVVSGLFQSIVYANEIENNQRNNNQEIISQSEEKKEDACQGKKDKHGHCVFIPEEKVRWNIKPQLLTGVMYFKHITSDQPSLTLSNKPIAFGGIGLNANIGNWFLNGYGLDTARTTDHIFQPKSSSTQTNEYSQASTEYNYNFSRQDYSISFGREITDLFTDSKDWGVSLFTGYRQGTTNIQRTGVNFDVKPSAVANFDPTKFDNTKYDPKNPETYPTAATTTTTKSNDYVDLLQTKYTVKGPLIGIAFRKRPFTGSNSEIGLTLVYGPLEGKYERSGELPTTARVNTFVSALSWNGELTDKLSYSLVFDYYSYTMPFLQPSKKLENISVPITVKEAVGSAKLFLNYRFN